MTRVYFDATFDNMDSPPTGYNCRCVVGPKKLRTPMVSVIRAAGSVYFFVQVNPLGPIPGVKVAEAIQATQ